MKSKKRRLLSEAKKDLELGIVKALSTAPLNSGELTELLAVTSADLVRDYGCDLYMAERVKNHAKLEQYRLRAQDAFTPTGEDSLYPSKPYTRSSPINESRDSLKEDHHDDGRMLDYGHVASDSHEGKMAKSSLRNIAVDSYRLFQMLNDGDDLPQWCEYKIAQAQQMMNSVREYLEYKLEVHGEDMPGELEMFTSDEEKNFDA